MTTVENRMMGYAGVSSAGDNLDRQMRIKWLRSGNNQAACLICVQHHGF